MDRLRWAILGCGHEVHTSVAPALLQDKHSRLVAFCAPKLAWAEQMRDQFGAIMACDRLEMVLSDDRVDAVYVASSVHQHCVHTIAAVEAGKHVVCQAPMAMGIDECRQMIAAAHAADVYLSVAYHRRFWPKARLMKQLIRQGRIGRPLSGRIRVSTDAEACHDKPGYTCAEPGTVQGAGVLCHDISSYRLDLMCYLLGVPDLVTSVADRVTTGEETVDIRTLLCRLHSAVHLVCEACRNGSQQSDEFEICGTEGTLTATPFDVGSVLVLDRHGDIERFHTPHPDGPEHLALIQDFTEAVTEGRPPAFDGRDGMLATAICDAACRSWSSRRWEAAL